MHPPPGLLFVGALGFSLSVSPVLLALCRIMLPHVVVVPLVPISFCGSEKQGKKA